MDGAFLLPGRNRRKPGAAVVMVHNASVQKRY